MYDLYSVSWGMPKRIRISDITECLSILMLHRITVRWFCIQSVEVCHRGPGSLTTLMEWASLTQSWHFTWNVSVFSVSWGTPQRTRSSGSTHWGTWSWPRTRQLCRQNSWRSWQRNMILGTATRLVAELCLHLRLKSSGCCCRLSVAFTSTENVGLLVTGSPGQPPWLSRSSRALSSGLVWNPFYNGLLWDDILRSAGPFQWPRFKALLRKSVLIIP